MASWLGKPEVDVYKDIHVNFLPLNSAYVILNTTYEHISVYSVKNDCYKCPLKRNSELYSDFRSQATTKFMADTKEPYTWRILKGNYDEYIQHDFRSGLICELRPSLGGYGVYNLNVGTCDIETEVQPPSIYLPLLLFTAILLSSIIMYGLVRLFLRRRNNESKYNEGLNLTASRDNLDIMPSLHFLRGLLLILIIFVTTGGGGYPIFFRTFGGLTVAECLFFVYTFSIGLKIPIMFHEESKKAMSKCSVFGTIFARSIFLCIMGLIISETAQRSRFQAVPLWAPLPRISIAYLVAATVYMFARKSNTQSKNVYFKVLDNIKSLLWSWVLAGLLLTFMVICIHVFYSTECIPDPDMNPDKMRWMSRGLYCQYSVFNEIFNKNLLSVNQDEAFYIDYYYGFTKGLLGILSSVLTALIGLKAGVIYLEGNHSDRTTLWHIWAFLLCLAGIVLGALSKVLQFNLSPIRTILLLSSFSINIHTFIYYLIETHKFSSNTITSCGVASMATLAGHLLFSQSFPFYWGESLDTHTHFFYLCQSTWVVLLWVVITAYWMKWRTFLITRVVSDEGTRRAVLSW